MYQTITFSDFIDAFHAYDRYDSFGYKGLRALFDYLEENENDLGDERGMELDVIALCCEWSQYDSVKDAWDAYDDTLGECEEKSKEEMIDALREYTTVIEYDEGVLVEAF
jgi:hypothetical protein